MHVYKVTLINVLGDTLSLLYYCESQESANRFAVADYRHAGFVLAD